MSDKAMDQAEFQKTMTSLKNSPAMRSGEIIEAFGGNKVLDSLAHQIEIIGAVENNNLLTIDRTLVSQAASLDQVFQYLAVRAARNLKAGHLEAGEKFMRLALKAQQQCTGTLKVLSEHKQPKNIVLANQANIANNQQVNNQGANNEEVDGIRAIEASGNNPPVAALETIDGCKIEGGEIEVKPERIEARGI